jgi:hypothetical protein
MAVLQEGGASASVQPVQRNYSFPTKRILITGDQKDRTLKGSAPFITFSYFTNCSQLETILA